MNSAEQRSILGIGLLAAYADGERSGREHEQLDRSLAGLEFQSEHDKDEILSMVKFESAGINTFLPGLESEESRKLAYQVAVCVCNADGTTSEVENRFLQELGSRLGLDVQTSKSLLAQAEVIGGAGIDAKPGQPASNLSAAELDKLILDAAILNGALELLPETLATLVIVPLQMKLVHRIGSSYGFNVQDMQIKDFLATAGVGLAAQVLEQAGRKLLGGLLGTIGGSILGGVGRQAASSGMAFASTYAVGQLARRYYAANRELSTDLLRSTFAQMRDDARSLGSTHLSSMHAMAERLRTTDLTSLVRSA
ncbi:MAG: GTPase [Elusimicrobia bacterium]|nr:MAG: GTPase [Gammaproteobacteria bacterium]TXH26752.1 MAG: GTPase [Elusimicrobiota bacterium]